MQKFLGDGGQSLADRKHHITRFVDGNEGAAAELSVTAVHSGPLYLPTGPVPATGKALQISAGHILHVDDEGRFDLSHIYVDFVGLLSQLSATAR